MPVHPDSEAEAVVSTEEQRHSELPSQPNVAYQDVAFHKFCLNSLNEGKILCKGIKLSKCRVKFIKRWGMNKQGVPLF